MEATDTMTPDLKASSSASCKRDLKAAQHKAQGEITWWLFTLGLCW